MVRLLVTGALGYIGAAFVRARPPARVERVVLLDDLSAGRCPTPLGPSRRPAFDFLEADVCTTDLDRCLDGVDVVVHLAAVTNSAAIDASPGRAACVNVGGARRVAEACARRHRRLLFVSTTSVYGAHGAALPEDGPAAAAALVPQTPYAAGKLRAERDLAAVGRRPGLDYAVLRLGTVFGPSPGMHFHTAVNRFIWQACTGRPLTVWRTALHQRRPYLDVRDAARALRFVVERDLFDGRTYNVATTHCTVAQVVAAIGAHVPETHVRLVDSLLMNELSYTVSTRRLRAAGFRYRGSLRAGVGATVALLGGRRPRRPDAEP